MIEVLTPIWQRVLQLSSIRVEDDFFDLGGDSLLALERIEDVAEFHLIAIWEVQSHMAIGRICSGEQKNYG